MLEIMDGRVGKHSVECVRYVITLGHCEIWSHFTRTLYFHSTSARDNTLTCVVSIIYIYMCLSCTEMRRWNYVVQTRACSKSDLGG